MRKMATANLHTKILNFTGFDSGRILSLRVGILMSIGSFPESSSQAILVGMILGGRLGVQLRVATEARARGGPALGQADGIIR